MVFHCGGCPSGIFRIKLMRVFEKHSTLKAGSFLQVELIHGSPQTAAVITGQHFRIRVENRCLSQRLPFAPAAALQSFKCQFPHGHKGPYEWRHPVRIIGFRTLPHPLKCRLQHLIRLPAIAQHAQCATEQNRSPAPIQLGERRAIAPCHPLDQPPRLPARILTQSRGQGMERTCCGIHHAKMLNMKPPPPRNLLSKKPSPHSCLKWFKQSRWSDSNRRPAHYE